MPPTPPPVILAIAGHDPGGGAGIQADIEAIAAQRCHAATAVTAVTVQDTRGVRALNPQPPDQVVAQAAAVLGELPVAAIKLGLLASAAIAEAVARLLADHPAIPLVLDPVLRSGTGDAVADDALLRVLREALVPRAAVVTPNRPEAEWLATASGVDASAAGLLAFGAAAVLVTGTHAPTREVEHRLYDRTGLIRRGRWPRLAGDYHGSGCTLASALAARLARGEPLPDAVAVAESYTWQSLRRARVAGDIQRLPDRLFGLDCDDPTTD